VTEEDKTHDSRLRMAAAKHAKGASISGVLSFEALKAGVVVDGQRIPLINPQRGIFKPKEMRFLLSVRTVYPAKGRKVWYDDQREVHEQIERGEELIDYAFMGDNPESPDNRWLREAMQEQIPVIYFLGVAPARYMVIWPTYIAEWLPQQLTAWLAFGAQPQSALKWDIPPAPERKYGLRLVRQRLHQASFREAVLTAYENRCAISGLPEPRLLDAAHIIVDGDAAGGQPIVPNGPPLSKLHHAAFDANLIGIDPDFRIHISDQLLSMNDGPMFEQGIKAIVGRTLRLPRRELDWPDTERLARRFEEFRAIS
jgi:putative restriction endonuclease